MTWADPDRTSEPGRTARESADASRGAQRIADDLRGRLGILERVIVSLVDDDALVVSVRPMTDRRDAYLLTMERGFHDALTAGELEAAVAHELGHVWIYSHHPYLQAEQLANRIALRVVTRESLERVYVKLWGAGAVTDDLAGFLGLPGDERTPAGTVVGTTKGAGSQVQR